MQTPIVPPIWHKVTLAADAIYDPGFATYIQYKHEFDSGWSLRTWNSLFGDQAKLKEILRK